MHAPYVAPPCRCCTDAADRAYLVSQGEPSDLRAFNQERIAKLHKRAMNAFAASDHENVARAVDLAYVILTSGVYTVDPRHLPTWRIGDDDECHDFGPLPYGEAMALFDQHVGNFRNPQKALDACGEVIESLVCSCLISIRE